MTDITKLSARLRADAKEEVEIDERNRLWSSGVNYAAHQLANALPIWTEIEWIGKYVDPSTLPPEDMTCMWVEKETGFNDVSEMWQLANRTNYTHWRPLCDLDYPPESK